VDDTQREFWNRAIAASAEALRPAPDAIRRLGNSEALSERLIGLVLRGEKTGTFSLPPEFDDGTAPAAGQQVLLCDCNDRPHAVLELERAETRRFDEIGTEDIACEGPKLRELEAWRAMHWDYWRGLLERHGREPSGDMPVICQRFRVLYPTGTGD